jgi:hypothetical protein
MYAAALKKGIAKSASDFSDDTDNIEPGVSKSNQNGYSNRTLKRKYIWRRDSSYDSWERSYFRELLELRDITARGLLEINSDNALYLYSHQFLYKFNKFIYENSSTTVTKFLEEMSSDLENIYSEYKEMRDRINESDE